MGFSRQECWVAMSSSRGSSQFRNQTCISCTGMWILYHWATWPFISWQFQELHLQQRPLPRTDHICRWQPGKEGRKLCLDVQNLNFWSTPYLALPTFSPVVFHDSSVLPVFEARIFGVLGSSPSPILHHGAQANSTSFAFKVWGLTPVITSALSSLEQVIGAP